MNRRSPVRPALLLAAATLSFGPVWAQDAQPPAEDPPAEAPAGASESTDAAPAPRRDVPVLEVSPPSASEPAPARRIERPPPPSASAPSPSPATQLPATIDAGASASRAPAPTPDPGVGPGTIVDVSSETAPEILPDPAEIQTSTIPATRPTLVDNTASAYVPWLAGGALLGGLVTYLLLRRRRRHHAYVEHDRYEERPVHRPVEIAPVAPVAARPAAPVASPPRPAPVAATPAVAPVVREDDVAAPVAAAVDASRPWLHLLVRPVRAGVANGEARVEFALDVANQGDAPAQDVRVSTWMFPAGSDGELERLANERTGGSNGGALPPTTIEAGGGARIEAAVAIPTAEVRGDSVLPVVVAEARYRLPNGSEGRTSSSFAVGVPDGEELAHFTLIGPSGLHEGVEARQLGEAERL